ncbi:MAG: hypothetical protein ACTSSH_00610 [Candidatus Heimdallarchaeota archaeon]
MTIIGARNTSMRVVLDMTTILELSSIKQLKEYLVGLNSCNAVNHFFKESLNIDFTFKSNEDLVKFLVVLEQEYKSEVESEDSKELGDFQTPVEFTKQVLEVIKTTDFQPEIILEPTFGHGNFIFALNEYFSNSLEFIYGVEIQQKHVWTFLINLIKKKILSKKKLSINYKIHHDDFFTHSFPNELLKSTHKKILIIGNPPWVTISELSALDAANLPEKSNIKGFSGIEALTGKSNFDIAETIIVKLLKQFANHNGKIALLCKDSVIRNIMKEQLAENYPISNIWAIKFDTRKVFNRKCDASLFLFDLGQGIIDKQCSVSLIEDPFTTIEKFGWVNNKFVSNIDRYLKYCIIEGKSQKHWRQGVKHDCAKILELSVDATTQNLSNKLGELVTVEEEVLYPLLKGSTIREFEVTTSTRKIILTQKSIKRDEVNIKEHFPRTWDYLNNHKEFFKKRKSKIFQTKNEFAIFGVGDYSFRQYKVAIAGLYKQPIFSLITPISNKAVIFDDTCYFIGFEKYEAALLCCTALNSCQTIEFLESISFSDSKRPFTKEILMRIDLEKIVKKLTFSELQTIWNQNNYHYQGNFTQEMFIETKQGLLERFHSF